MCELPMYIPTQRFLIHLSFAAMSARPSHEYNSNRLQLSMLASIQAPGEYLAGYDP